MLVTQPYGYKPHEIGIMTLTELGPYELAYKKSEEQRLDEEKYMIWMQGLYFRDAINSSIMGNSQWYCGKNHKWIEYPKQPYGEEPNKKEISAEKEEDRALAEMKVIMMQLQSMGLPEAPE